MLVCVNGIVLVCVFDDVVFMVCVSVWWLCVYCYSVCDGCDVEVVVDM